MMLHQTNKKGGSKLTYKATKDFNNCVSDCDLIELEHRGLYFTWERAGVFEKIDWVLCSSAWKTKFPYFFVDHLEKVKLDHRPLLIHLGTNDQKEDPKAF